jgi:hypothetical protein
VRVGIVIELISLTLHARSRLFMETLTSQFCCALVAQNLSTSCFVQVLLFSSGVSRSEGVIFRAR